LIFACFLEENTVEENRAERRGRRNTQNMKEVLMKTTCWRGCLPLFAVTLLLIYSAPAEAQVNLALSKPCIDQSSRWNGQAQYDCSHTTDGLVCEIDQNEGGTLVSSYWLGAQGQLNETLMIDLEAPTTITEIRLRNTHNAQYNDRNTLEFQIDAANEIQVCGTGKRAVTMLLNPVTILVGVLSNADRIVCPDEIPPDIFDSTTGLDTGGTAFRYVQFTAVSSYHPSNNVGLNELEVYGSQ
jgi:hypothetical protein